LKAELLYFYFFLLSMMIIRPHNLGHELDMLIRIGSRLLHHSISFYFYVEFCSYFFNRSFFFFLLWICFLDCFYFFNFIIQYLIGWKLGFIIFSMWWSRSYNPRSWVWNVNSDSHHFFLHWIFFSNVVFNDDPTSLFVYILLYMRVVSLTTRAVCLSY